MLPYERFVAWQACHRLALAVYALTRAFPTDERYGLSAQARRAAFSAAANIAEGSAKKEPREFRRFLDTSLGSLSELAHVLHIARALGLIERETWERFDRQRDEAGKLVWGLYHSVRRRLPSSAT